MRKNDAGDQRAEDLQLLALLVGKRLRQEHCIHDVSGVGGYRIAPSRAYVQAGEEVQVDVSLGRGLEVTVYDVWWEDEPDLDSLCRNAEDLSGTIASVLRDAKAIAEMVGEVTAAARKEIAKARRRGLPYRLTSVTLPQMAAGGDDHVVVRVEHLALGRSLQLEPFELHAESADEVAAAFAGIADEQGRQVYRRASLDRIGATGTIDAVVVAAIGAAGLDLPHVLATLRDSESWSVDLDVAEGERLTLHWDDGTVRGHIPLGEGVSWHKGRLLFGKAERTLRKLPKGSPIRQLFEHPFLDERIRIRGDYKTDGAHLSVNCDEAMLNFDADSGRLWAA